MLVSRHCALRTLKAGISLAILSAALTDIAQAQEAGSPAAAESGLADIVVTAQKREQNLNDVGLSISALSGSALASQRISTVADLATATPGLTFAPAPNSAPVYTLRGVGFFESTLAAYPAVSLYIDQMPLPLPIMASLTAFDLERVEVLKGPQGTLFGNNATGGAINFIAAKPASTFGAGVELGYGRFNTFDVSAYITGPISDTLSARLALKAVNGDEWQRSYTRQDKIGRQDNIAARLLLDWTPSDRLKVSFNLNGWRDQSDPTTPQAIAITPQNAVGSAGLGGVLTGTEPIFNYPMAPKNARAADWTPEMRPFADNEFWQLATRIDFEVTDDITLTSLTSYDNFNFNARTEGDGTALQNLDLFGDVAKIETFTQELRIANDPRNALRWLIGANMEHTDYDQVTDLTTRDTTSYFVNGISLNAYDSHQKMRNYAIFGNVEFDVSDQFTLKGGIRQTKAKRRSNGSDYERAEFPVEAGLGLTDFFNQIYGIVYGGVVPPIEFGDSIAIDTRVNPDGTPVNPETYLTTGRYFGKLNENNTSWSLGVDYKPAPGTLIYANVSKGYKAGSFPLVSGSVWTAYEPVIQESLLSYEIGFKSQLFDRRLSINAAAFYSDYKNKQLRAKFVDPIFGALDKLVNVPKSRIKGVEVELNARPVPGLSLSASGLYVDASV